jgi:phosphoglycerate dehydrogenase-like enzyme
MHDVAAAAGVCKLWQVLGTGLDHVDVAYMRTKPFAVANCPGQFSSVGLAECAMMYILMLTRHYHQAVAVFRSGARSAPLGIDLDGLVLGIIGFGSSGQELARRARGFGLRIQAVDIVPPAACVIDELKPEFVGTPDDIDRVVAASDFLSVHLHLTDQTRHTIDARRLGLMKPEAFLINVARGALVDEAAMYDALLNGRLAGAGLDVFANEPPDPSLPVYQLPNVITTPHIAGATTGTARKRARAAAENVDRVARGLDPLYRVDQNA